MTVLHAYRGGDANGRPGWWLAVTYDAELIDQLKRRIPHTDRVWDSEARRWWVADAHEEALFGLLPQLRAHKLQGQLL